MHVEDMILLDRRGEESNMDAVNWIPAENKQESPPRPYGGGGGGGLAWAPPSWPDMSYCGCSGYEAFV